MHTNGRTGFVTNNLQRVRPTSTYYYFRPTCEEVDPKSSCGINICRGFKQTLQAIAAYLQIHFSPGWGWGCKHSALSNSQYSASNCLQSSSPVRAKPLVRGVVREWSGTAVVCTNVLIQVLDLVLLAGILSGPGLCKKHAKHFL